MEMEMEKDVGAAELQEQEHEQVLARP